MDGRPRHLDEINRFQRCINDLVSVLALPAAWSGSDPSRIVDSLLDALLRLLPLDFAYVRLKHPDEGPIETVRLAQAHPSTPHPEAICKVLNDCLGDDPVTWPSLIRKKIGDRDISLMTLRLGLQGELGLIVAGSRRSDFPRDTEKLILSVAANQGSIGLHEARLRNKHMRVASALDERVARSEERWRSVFENSAIGVALTDPNGLFIATNPVYERMLGYTEEELQNLSFLDITHQEYLEANRTLVDELLEGKRRQFQIEKQYRRKDGKSVWVSNNVSIVPGTDRVPRFLMALSEDITERKLAEEALRASERNLSLNINAMPTLLASARPDGWGDFFNQRWLDYTGLSAEQLEGWGWATPLHPDDAEGLLMIWRSSLVSGTPLEAEARMRRFDGVYRWLLFRANALRDESGEIVKWYGTASDIDDRKRAEEALRASERDLHEAQRLSHTGSWKLDLSSGRVTVSPEVFRIFAVKSDEDISSPEFWFSRIHPEDRQRVQEHFERCLTQKVNYEGDYRIVLPDGTIKYQHAIGHPILNESGALVEFPGTAMDVTEQVQAQEKVRRSEALLAESQRLSLTGSFLWRVVTDELIWSKQLYRIFEFDLDALVTLELIGTRIHPEDRSAFQRQIERSRRDGSDVQLDLRLQLPDSSVKYINIIAHSSPDESGQLEYIGAVQDVTQRRLSEEALAKARSELAHVARVTSLGVMTASIAHEVNQPLSGIITNSSTCLRMLAADPPNLEGARETARRTIRDGNRAADVIKRLRALFSKKEIPTESVDLNEATREVIALSLSELQRNRLILQLELAGDLPLVTGDRVQLQQVILNLLRNASDAMSTVDDRPRQLLIRTERDEADRVRLTVKDQGVGFDPHAVEKLFEEFHTTKNEGMGIGLSVSRSIIESHQGRLWATLNDGPGASFSFSIPRRSEDVSVAESARALGTPAATDAA